MTTLGLKNVNMLSKEQYDGVAEPVRDELWTVEVETYSDDDGNWYRVYPDGWIEQGGQYRTATTQRQTWGVINFLKPFSNTNYTIQATPHSPYRSSDLLVYMGMASIGNKTTTKVDVGAYGISDADKNNGFDWYACGK